MFRNKLKPREVMEIIQYEFAEHGRCTDRVNKIVEETHIKRTLANLAAFRGLKIFREKH